ncbi:MAG: hypothetical protein HP494_13570 [Nitrospira sp.]|nr:hypothetical protein [Nitrospira sp.]
MLQIGRILNGCLLCAAVWMGYDPAQVSASTPHDTRRPVPLYDNLGTLHHAITTSSEEAQRYFDQGLRFVYAFNHDEAVQAFEESAKLDPTAGMAYWGIALALGPNINAAMGRQQERRAMEALGKARAQSARLSEAERRYIDALSKRYLSKGRSRAALDKVYAEAMRALWREFPDDPDAGVLFAESMMDLRPWDLWTAEGQPRPGTDEIVSTLESILSKHPDHPGACHYYIHTVEAMRLSGMRTRFIPIRRIWPAGMQPATMPTATTRITFISYGLRQLWRVDRPNRWRSRASWLNGSARKRRKNINGRNRFV